MKVKMCGLYRQEDIDYANEVQPDYVGFVFYPKSHRVVTKEQAAEYRKKLSPGIRTVGVFVNEDPKTIIELLEEGILDVAQLHGDETEEDIQYLQAVCGKPVIKAVKVRDRYDVEAWLDSSADYLLFDNGMGTGQAFVGYTILRKHEDFIGKSLKIAEKVDYYRLILQIIDEISPLSGIDYDGLTGDFGLLSRIYNAVLSIEKDGLEEWKKHADFPDPDGLGCLYQKLKERMKEEGYICFDEQIQLTNQLFSEYPDVLKSYQQRFRYVMIDEFQDISSDQVDLAYAIASHGNIVVVGDDDQSIYSWRGGSNYYLLHFQEMWSNSKIVILPDNFRSVDHILEAANALIANNTNRYRKSLRSHHRATVRPIYRKNVLVDTIRDLVASAERSGYKPGDIAIIARKNKALEKIKKSLDGFYLATSPKTLLIKDEVFIAIRDTFSLYVTNFHDPLALYRQLKRNGYELDIPVERDHMLESFLKYFNLPEPDLYDPDLLEIYEASGSPGIALARTLSSCKKLLYAQDLSDAVRSIYQFLWQKKEHPAVEELCSRIEMRAINTASEFLNHMNAMIEFSDTAEVEYPASPDTITLLTAHKSKGKEFPTVVIYGVEEFEESEEGRNLLYVSMTRAKRNLFLLQGSFSDAPLYPEFKNYVD